MSRALATNAAAFVPNTSSLKVLSGAAQECKGCPLFENATQGVFGEGPVSAQMFLIGEQPGNEEDRQGHPFVGPAGGILNRAFSDAGIDRDNVYLTNAVKHFKFEERGKRRLHKKPNSSEVRACEPWLEAEARLIRPKVIVCLGATAAQALFGNKFRVTQERGKPLDHVWATYVIATVHPSSILRTPEARQRQEEYGRAIRN